MTRNKDSGFGLGSIASLFSFGNNRPSSGYSVGSNTYNDLNGAMEGLNYENGLRELNGQKLLSANDININSGSAANSSGMGSFLQSDSLKGLGSIAGIATDIYGIITANKGLKQAEKQWEAENARANEIMAMNREKYNTFKADKARLNSQYAG